MGNHSYLGVGDCGSYNKKTHMVSSHSLPLTNFTIGEKPTSLLLAEALHTLGRSHDEFDGFAGDRASVCRLFFGAVCWIDFEIEKSPFGRAVRVFA
jgi:hypothetical protein